MGVREKDKTGFWKSLFARKGPSPSEQPNGKTVNTTPSFCCFPRQVPPLSFCPLCVSYGALNYSLLIRKL